MCVTVNKRCNKTNESQNSVRTDRVIARTCVSYNFNVLVHAY